MKNTARDNMKPFQQIFYMTAIVALGSHVAAVPLDTTSAGKEEKPEETQDNASPVSGSAGNKTEKDLETANSNQEPTYVVSLTTTFLSNKTMQFKRKTLLFY